MTDWKGRLEKFIFQKDPDGNPIVDLKYLQGIPKSLLGRAIANLLLGEKRRYWEEAWEKKGKDEDSARRAFMNFIEATVDDALRRGEYSSFVLPTITTERNLKLGGEQLPHPEVVWKCLYLQYSSINFGGSLINFDDLPEEGRRDLWRTLITEKVIIGGGVDTRPLKDTLGVRMIRSGKFFRTLVLLTFIREKAVEKHKEDPWLACCKEYGFSNATSVIVMAREGEKGEYHEFSNPCILINNWADRNTVRFFDSFTNIRGVSGNVLEHISKEREKAIFYLLKHQTMNGELLARLTRLKSVYEVQAKERIGGIIAARPVFSKIASDIS